MVDANPTYKGKFGRRSEQTLVPPPPPTDQPSMLAGSPPAPFMPAVAGGGIPTPFPQGAPQIGSAPSFNIGPSNQPTLVSKEVLDRQAALQKTLNDQRDRFATNAQNIGDKFMSVPDQLAMSQSSKQLNDAINQHMLKLLSNKPNAMERFDRGFDAGQKVAANLILPLMGVASHTAGGQLGYLNSGQQLNQQVSQNRALRRQEEAERNAALLNFANLHENMDPESAKNLMALASARLQANQYNRQLEHDANADALNANKAAAENQLKSDTFALKGSEEADKSLFRKNQLEEKTKNDQGNLKVKQDELPIKQQNADAATSNAASHSKDANTNVTKANNVNNIANDKKKATAGKNIQDFWKNYDAKVTAQGMFGSKYKNYSDMVSAEKGNIEWLKQQYADAGLKSDAEADFAAHLGIGKNQPKEEGKSLTDMVGEAVGKTVEGAKQLAGISKRKMGYKEGHESFLKEYGRDPKDGKELMDYIEAK